MLIIAIIITFFFSLDTNSQKPVKIYGLPGNNSLRISNALFNLWLPLVVTDGRISSLDLVNL